MGFLTPALISTVSAYLEERLLIVAEPMFPEAPITNTIGILIFAFDWVEEESTFRSIVGGTGTGRQCKIATERFFSTSTRESGALIEEPGYEANSCNSEPDIIYSGVDYPGKEKRVDNA